MVKSIMTPNESGDTQINFAKSKLLQLLKGYKHKVEVLRKKNCTIQILFAKAKQVGEAGLIIIGLKTDIYSGLKDNFGMNFAQIIIWFLTLQIIKLKKWRD